VVGWGVVGFGGLLCGLVFGVCCCWVCFLGLGIHNIGAPEGANKGKKRVGRGPGSGHGKTSTRGHKGQKSRSGYSGRPGFEGGQMPLQRRLPKRGFTNIFKKEWLAVNLADLELRFDAKDEVTPELMVERGLIKKGKLARSEGVVILGKGSLSKALNITAHRFSKSASEKIQSAGGVATTVAGPVAEATSENAE
jgi:large subunit ribosomal protein L15